MYISVLLTRFYLFGFIYSVVFIRFYFSCITYNNFNFLTVKLIKMASEMHQQKKKLNGLC